MAICRDRRSESLGWAGRGWNWRVCWLPLECVSSPIRLMPTRPSKSLEVVPNPHPDRDYEVTMTVPEFTCLCPLTGQPDFATLRIRYVPDQRLVELKSLKLYVWSYRNEGAFHEDVTNRILDDFVAAARPRWVEIVGDFSVRGGIKTEIRVTYGKRPEV